MKKLTTIILGVICLIYAILSARLNMPYMAFATIGFIILSLILAVYNALDKKLYPLLIFCIGLALLYQTTLISNNLIGTDIHTEYFIYQSSLNGWNINYSHAYNTSIFSTIVAPFLTNTFHIPGYFIYKAIFPALFALVPVFLYWIYQSQFSKQVSFIACIIFITVPTYMLEMIGLPRQMMGELFLVLIFYFIICKEYTRYKLLIIIVISSILAYLSHYVMGLITLMYMIGSTIMLYIFKILNKVNFINKPRIAVWIMILAIIIPAIIGFSYYENVANGEVNKNFKSLIGWLETNVTETESIQNNPTTTMQVEIDQNKNYFEKQEPLIRTALGLDFLEASTAGKIFRVFQYLTQILLIIGCIWLIIKRKKISPEYIAFTCVSVVILVACIFLPRFSNIINATRFYHIAMFFLAPLIIMGGLMIFRKIKILTFCFIIPVILINTGVIFEVLHEDDISNVNAPYSIALSNDRIKAVPIYSDNDVNVAQYIVDNEIEPVLTDINGMLLLSQDLDPFEYIIRSSNTGRYYQTTRSGIADLYGQNISNLTHGWGYLPNDISLLGNETYIYLTEKSVVNQTVTFKPQWYNMTDSASGMRTNYSFDYINLDISKLEVVYQSGNSILLLINY